MVARSKEEAMGVRRKTLTIGRNIALNIVEVKGKKTVYWGLAVKKVFPVSLQEGLTQRKRIYWLWSAMAWIDGTFR